MLEMNRMEVAAVSGGMMAQRGFMYYFAQGMKDVSVGAFGAIAGVATGNPLVGVAVGALVDQIDNYELDQMGLN